ncbi:hypothetical protein ACFX2C_008686 [Malus domestica]
MPLWDRDRETEGEGDSERERGRGRSGDPRFCTVKERPRVSHRGLFDYISVRFHPHFFPSFSFPTLSHCPILSRPLTVSLRAYMNSMRSHHLLSAKRRRTQQIVCYSSPIISVCFLQLFVSGGFDVFLNLLINSDGEFNTDGLDRFVKEVKLTECGLSYTVVAVMGPQSSGKRTLLNHLFRTKFREMDAYSGRSQTTKSIWIAKRVGSEPCTIAMDLEGTDGRERGEKAISTPLQAEERPHTSPTVANVSVISLEDATTTLRSFWKMESTRLKDLGPKENDLERLTKLNFDIEINENPLV